MRDRVAKRRAGPPERALGRKLLLAGFGLLPVAVLGLWIAVNRVEWLGPLVADGLRSVVGKDAVTELEDAAYSIQDRFFQYYRRDEKPKAYWSVPVSSEPAAAVAPPTSGDAAGVPSAGTTPPAEAAHPFVLEPVGPVHASWSAPGDGVWVPIATPDVPVGPRLWKTLLHPDKERSWAELFVVAMEIASIDLHLVAGTREPVATEVGALEIARPGHIAEQYHDTVLAAFNGGFKTEHGQYGMSLGALDIVRPRDGVCAIVLFDDASIRIASWEHLASERQRMQFVRQTPNCMYEDGSMHPKLREGQTKKWGATLDGETVIRRSAIGIDAANKVLFMGISNHTTATAIAQGMYHAGAVTVAQLDINYSYPKFVLFEKKPGEEKRLAVALAEGFEFSEDEFIREPARRDFFFITPRESRPNPAIPAADTHSSAR
jgi:hypothetical protein